MKWIAKDDKLLITYYELTDTQLQTVRNNSNYYTDKDFISEIMQSRGRHAHVFGIVCEEPIDWLDEWRKREQDYDSLSWWNREENKFYFKEVICPQSQLV